MSGWLRYLALRAQVRTGVSNPVVISAIIATMAAMVAIVFFLIAAFIWLADRYDAVIAGVVMGCVFLVVALVALVVCLLIRRGNMERARLELAARSSNANWLDPKVMAMGFQVAQAIGWRRLASLAAVAVLAAGLTREWSGGDKPPDADEAPPE
jgi:predicted lysophospholipase L1 biosynthesis ABC-type transport system permease subunit